MSKRAYTLTAIGTMLILAAIQPALSVTPPSVEKMIVIAPNQVYTGDIFTVRAETYVKVYG